MSTVLDEVALEGAPELASLLTAAVRASPEEPVVLALDIGTSGNALPSSSTWAQMIADVLGRPIKLSHAREASCRGAALLALEAAGKIDSVETARPEFGEVYEPNMTRHASYAQAIERQQELYERLMK